MSVTVVSCVYGISHDRFIPDWLESVRGLNTAPSEVIVAADHLDGRDFSYPEVFAFAGDHTWRYPQAFYLNEAIGAAETEWVWILDIDDRAMPDALDGLDQVEADVWQMGYVRDDGVKHIPPSRPDPKANVFTAGSAIRTRAFHEVGGFRDVAFQDWDLWSRMLLLEFEFESSGRAHYRYRQHAESRTLLELGEKNRVAHIEEMHA